MAHKHAEFLRYIADGGAISDWEMQGVVEGQWITLTDDAYWLRSIYLDTDRFIIRRKSKFKTSRERFEEWSRTHIWRSPFDGDAWDAWQEAEKQVRAMK